MKRILLVLLALVFIYPIISSGANKDSVNLKLVWEKEFSEPTIDVIIDTLKVENKIKFFPKIKIIKIGSRRVIEYYDSKSRLKIKAIITIIDDSSGVVESSIVNVSANNKYLLLSYRKYPDIEGGYIYSSTGELLYTITNGYPIDINNQGYTLVKEHSQEPGIMPNSFLLYNNKGNMIQELVNPLKGLEGYSMAKFTNDQKHIIFGVTTTTGSSYLILKDIKNNPIWRKNIRPTIYINECDTKENEGISIIERFNINITYLDWFTGEEKWKRKWDISWGKMEGWKNLKILEDGNLILFGKNTKLICFDKYAGKIKWIYSNNNVIDIIELNNNLIVLNRKNGISYLDILSIKNGIVLKENNLGKELWKKIRVYNNNLIQITSSNKVVVLELKIN